MVMTKLLGPRPQVTLSQVPPSKKETWGAEDNQVSQRVLAQTKQDKTEKTKRRETKELGVMWLVMSMSSFALSRI